MTRALVVDDSHFMRTVISDILSDGGVDVVDTAANGRQAVQKVATVEDVATADPTAGHGVEQTAETATNPESGPEYVDNPTLVVGASTGGPNVVESILRTLPRAAGFRVLIVQHMPDQFTSRFAARLDESSEYDIAEAEDGGRIGAGEGVVARGDHHMRVSGYSRGRLRVRLGQRERKHSVRPSIDVTMESAAGMVSDPLVVVVLTGMGTDGASGIEAVKNAGGTTLAQDEATSAVYDIPQRAVETGCVDGVHAADRLTEAITDSIRRSS